MNGLPVVALVGATVALAAAHPFVSATRRRDLQRAMALVVAALVVTSITLLRSTDGYFDRPGQLVWDNHRDTGQRAVMVGVLVLAGAWAVLLFLASLRRGTWPRLPPLVAGAAVVSVGVMLTLFGYAAH